MSVDDHHGCCCAPLGELLEASASAAEAACAILSHHTPRVKHTALPSQLSGEQSERAATAGHLRLRLRFYVLPSFRHRALHATPASSPLLIASSPPAPPLLFPVAALLAVGEALRALSGTVWAQRYRASLGKPDKTRQEAAQ